MKRNICLKQRLNCISKISKFVCDTVNRTEGVESWYLNNYLHTYMFYKLSWNASRNFETACKNVILNVVESQVQDLKPQKTLLDVISLYLFQDYTYNCSCYLSYGWEN